MNAKQQSAYSMHLRVLAFSKKNNQQLSGFIVLDNLISRLENSLTKMGALREQQDTNISGLSDKKESLRATACKQAMEVSRGILLYAGITGNEILANEVSYTETELKRCKDIKLSTTLAIINTAAQQNQPGLVNYGLSAEKIAGFKSAIDAYNISIGTPKDANIARKQVTGNLEQCFYENARIIRKIDLLMGTLRYTEPELYAEYKDNRRTVRRSRFLRAKVKVTDSCTAGELGGVRIQFMLDKVVKLDKKSAAGGGLIIKSLDEGVYSVCFSKIGYIARQLTVNITKSEFARVNIALEKEE